MPTIGWLAQILFALTFDAAGWRGVQILHGSLWAGGFAIAGLTAARYGNPEGRLSLFSLAVALTLGSMAGWSNAMLRPQSFAVLCFALVMLLVRRMPASPGSWLLLCLVAVLWQNTHPSVLIGMVAVGFLAAAAWLGRMLHQEGDAPWTLTIATLILALAQLATPMGWNIFVVSATNLEVARDWLRISEWMPPWDVKVRGAMHGFYLACSVSAVILIALKFRIRRLEWSLLIGMTALSLTAARFVPFWAVAMIPLWTRWTEILRRSRFFDGSARRSISPRGFGLFAALGCVAAVGMPSAVQGPSEFLYSLDPCLKTLKALAPTGRIYNFREWGGPLIFAGHPRWRVAIDGRLYNYSRQDWMNYNKAAMGRLSLRDIISEYHPDAFFLHPKFHRPLVAVIDKAESHTQVYQDELCAIFVPRVSHPKNGLTDRQDAHSSAPNSHSLAPTARFSAPPTGN